MYLTACPSLGGFFVYRYDTGGSWREMTPGAIPLACTRILGGGGGGGFLFISFSDGGLRTTYIHTCIHNPARRGGKMYIYLHQAWARAYQSGGDGEIFIMEIALKQGCRWESGERVRGKLSGAPIRISRLWRGGATYTTPISFFAGTRSPCFVITPSPTSDIWTTFKLFIRFLPVVSVTAWVHPELE